MAFWLWAAIAAVLLLVVLALSSSIRVRVRYSRSGKLDQLVVVIRAFYGLFNHQIVLPSIVIRGWDIVYREKRSGAMAKNKEKKRIFGFRAFKRYRKAYRGLLTSTKQFKRWIRQSLGKVECTRWRLDFKVGTGDAASTAVVTGLLWAVAGCASGIVGHWMQLKATPDNRVEPNYSSAEFTVVWEADFRIGLGSVVWSIMKLGTRTISLGKSVNAWRNWLTPPKQA